MKKIILIAIGMSIYLFASAQKVKAAIEQVQKLVLDINLFSKQLKITK